MISLHVCSLPLDNEIYPIIPGRVRGLVKIIGFVFKPIITDKGEEHCDYFMTNCIDINGSIPKWIQNATSAIVPKTWIGVFEKGC